MAFIQKIFSFIWRAISIFAPIASVLWGVSVYSTLAYLLYVIVQNTADLIHGFDLTFVGWADNVSGTFADIFAAVSENSYFQFFAYVLSLDVPFDWFRSCIDTFLRFWLTYAVGGFVSVVEVTVIVLGVYFVRSRIKKMSIGVPGGDGGSST